MCTVSCDSCPLRLLTAVVPYVSVPSEAWQPYLCSVRRDRCPLRLSTSACRVADRCRPLCICAQWGVTAVPVFSEAWPLPTHCPLRPVGSLTAAVPYVSVLSEAWQPCMRSVRRDRCPLRLSTSVCSVADRCRPLCNLCPVRRDSRTCAQWGVTQTVHFGL